MERFKRINWNHPLEHLMDDDFIKDEKMKEESQMYKILTDSVVDPFENIEDDYADIDIELLKRLGADVSILEDDTEDEEECKPNKKLQKRDTKTEVKQNSKEKQNVAEKQEVTEKPYIPGLKKSNVPFPKPSVLDVTQHSICIRALLRLFNHEQTPMSTKEKAELENYMALQKIISAEQAEFLEHAKTQWDSSAIQYIKCNKFLISKWKEKWTELQKLPKDYTESTSISFSSDKKITINFVSYLQQSSLPKVIFPDINRPYYFNVKDIAYKKYLSSLGKQRSQLKLPVSEDTYCESFAKKTKADLVISSSGLKCLLSNVSSHHTNSWLVPVVIKSHNGKNVIYIDKKLPPETATVSQKNTWIYKYILRHFFVHDDDTDMLAKETMCVKADKSSSDINVDDKFKSFNECLEDYKKDRYQLSTDDSEDSQDMSLTDKEQKNVTYSLFTIRPIDPVINDLSQYQLRKNVSNNSSVQEYQVLIRTKTDGNELLPNGQLKPLILAPKMEHQVAFGAEAITLEEGLQQWVSLIFRPEVSLARVRISSQTNELIQIEKHTAVTLAAEIKRLYNVKVEDSLAILYNLIEKLSSLTPGRYIVRHTAHNGPFAYVYKETEDCGKAVFNLKTMHQSRKFPTISMPWPAIDPMMVTPMLKYYNRMPAMFRPREYKTRQSYEVTPQKCSPSETRKMVQNERCSDQKSPLRRSLRKKKPSIWCSELYE